MVPSQVCAQSDPSPFETRILRQISAYNIATVAVGDSERSSIMTNTGRKSPWAFQQRYVVRTLPLSPPKGGSKSNFLFF